MCVEAIRKRDSLFERLAADGEWVPERGEEGDMPAVQPLLDDPRLFDDAAEQSRAAPND